MLWHVAAWVGVCVVMVVVFSRYVPFAMDEFIHYHSLMCWFYPANNLNTFRESCDAYAMNFLNSGLVLRLRPFPYSGSFPSLYYLPLFLIWRSPLSARLLGLLFLSLQAVTSARMYGYRAMHIFVALLLFFPYVFAHLVDTGPVMFHTTSVFLLLFLFRQWHRRPIRTALAVGAIIALGIWTKLVYFWVLPGVAMLCAMALIEHRKEWRAQGFGHLVQCMLIAAGIVGIIAGSMFLSTDPGNATSFPFWEQLATGGLRPLSEIFLQWHAMPIIALLRNPLAATHGVFSPQALPYPVIGDVYAIIVYLLPLAFSLALLGSWKYRHLAWRPIVCGVAYVVTMMLILRTGRAIAIHHAALAMPFLILTWMEVFRVLRAAARGRALRAVRLARAACVGIFVLINLFVLTQFARQPIYDHAHPSKIGLHAMLGQHEVASNYLYVVADWGMYYFQGLFGDRNQGVLYIEPFNAQSQVDALHRLQMETGRKLLFVYNARAEVSDINLIRSSFGVDTCAQDPNEPGWEMLAESADQIPGCKAMAEGKPKSSLWASLLQ